jgi:cell division protein FtsI/penicillin-binding protein 2
LPGEAKGTIPDRTTMEEKYGEKIPAGEVLNDAIGQGHVLVSPIQLLMVLTAIANQGQVLRPTLLSQVCTPEGEIISSTERVVRSDLRLSPVTVDTILEGLAGVVNRFGENREHLVGKTGSAENPHGDTHAWFVGFAPQENPRISLVIFVENGGFGESYIKYAKQIVAFCREQGIPDSDWWNLNLATLEETIPQE